jgi:hypothetical protein
MLTQYFVMVFKTKLKIIFVNREKYVSNCTSFSNGSKKILNFCSKEKLKNTQKLESVFLYYDVKAWKSNKL